MNRPRVHRPILCAIVIALAAYVAACRRAEPVAAAVPTPDSHPSAAARAVETPRGGVELDTRRQQLIGVRTATVTRAPLEGTLRLAGTVVADETRQSEISTRVDGWIRELVADSTGRVIRRGEPLFTIYSPDVVATQQEFLLALRGRATTNPGDAVGQEYADRLVSAARERLLRLDVPPEEVEQLERTGKSVEAFTFRSPVSGTIVEKVAVRGMRVMAGQMLYRVADLSSVWVEAEAFETDLGRVGAGTRATVTFDAYPQRTFTGRVSFVSPTITPETRTARVRIALSNPGGLLKPNMLAEAAVATRAASALVVPADALVNTGTETLAFVAEGGGRFTPRRVRVGRTTGEHVEVLSGLRDGEAVASSATFFLDSESQLRGALQTYDVPPHPAGTAAAARPSAVDITFRSDPESPAPGDVTLIVTVKEGDKAVTDAEVSVVLSMPGMPAMNMPAMRTEARLSAVGGGVYRGTGQLMTPGRWDVAVAVRRHGEPAATRQFALIAR